LVVLDGLKAETIFWKKPASISSI